jgi:hypothetical protein
MHATRCGEAARHGSLSAREHHSALKEACAEVQNQPHHCNDITSKSRNCSSSRLNHCRRPPIAFGCLHQNVALLHSLATPQFSIFSAASRFFQRSDVVELLKGFVWSVARSWRSTSGCRRSTVKSRSIAQAGPLVRRLVGFCMKSKQEVDLKVPRPEVRLCAA